MNHRSEILRLRETERLSEREIARRLEIHASTVHYWLAKEHNPQPPRRRGRPRITTPLQDTALYEQSLAGPFQSAVDVRDAVTPGISVDTVRKRLKERGLRCRIPARKPFLKPHHVEKRLEFARRYQYWGVDQWSKVLFSDEKIFRSSSRGQVRVYRPVKSDRFQPEYVLSEQQGGRFSICVWMAFSRDFHYIHRVERRTLNSEYYTERILSAIHEAVQANDLIYMHDLASIHTSAATRHWIESHNMQIMEDWPPKGPDMNPIENVWAELVRRIRNNPTNRDQLWENVYAAYNSLEKKYYADLVRSMPRRMEKVIAAQGQWTKY